ncbi:MAG: DUF1449 family protein [Phycisphaerae bacterium]|nr:DUF1449 family protein [Phycisphaerae bacterium]
MPAMLLVSSVSALVSGTNLPFLAALFLAVLFTVLSVLGLGGSDGDADADAGLDADHDVDVDHDIDVDHDVDVDHDIDHDAEVNADQGPHVEGAPDISLSAVLYFFGIGKVPLSILMLSFFYAFGGIGWLLNLWLTRGSAGAESWLAASLPGGFVAGLTSMRLVSSLLARIMPTRNVSGTAPQQLVGLRGVAGLPVTETGGRAQITDRAGTRHVIRCRVKPGTRPVPNGKNVIVVKYVAKDRLYYVAADRAAVGKGE